MAEKTIYKISVRELVNYTMLSGDIDSRFTTNASALDGTRLHKKLQKNAGKNYASEVSLVHTQNYQDYTLLIQGRADGIITKKKKVTVDEIKTTKRPLETIEIDKDIHSAQAKCYAYIYALQNNLTEIGVRITYCHVSTEEVKYFEYNLTIIELEEFFKKVIEKFVKKLNFTNRWRAKRNLSLKSMEFPFESYRKNQRQMAVSVYKTIEMKKNIYLQAPTGTGKTISSLFPSLKALGQKNMEKIFYLTSKTTIRKVAEETVDLLAKKGAQIKYVTLTAKDKICFMEKTNCIPDYCPYAKGYFDRRNKAVEDIIKYENRLSRETIEIYAREHKVCPFEYQLDISMEADIIICDYNYLFDPNVALKRMFGPESPQKDYIFLVDEAHNLPERAREMYSAVLEEKSIKDLRNLFKNKDKKVEEALKKLAAFCSKLKRDYLIDQNNKEKIESYIDKKIPEKTYETLRKFNQSVEEYLLENNEDEKTEKLKTLYFDVIMFQKIIEIFDENYLMYMQRINGITIKLFCLDPSQKIKEATSKGSTAVFFSATLVPAQYFKTLLGYDKNDMIVSFDSPFEAKNRKIMIAPDISTKYKNREYSYDKVAKYIHQMTQGKKGNYIAFFPSYKYMNSVYQEYLDIITDNEIFCQDSDMSEEEREEFLQKFQENPQKTHLGFCVMGGVFSEGIDLKGERLIGVAIVGVGLPQVGLEREIINQFFREKNGKGFEYAYTYPGINKVLQSAGRLIRTVEDKGVILLIDERYMENQYQRLLPRDWYPCRKVNQKTITKELEEFWKQ